MASDGTVTIKVQANDTALKDLLKSVKDLKRQLDNLSGTSPFTAIQRDAQSAVQALTGVSDGVEKVDGSLDSLDGGNIDDIGKSADQADSELDGLAFAADDVNSELSNIDGSTIDYISASAEDADVGLMGMNQTIDRVDDSLSGFEASGIDEVGTSADKSEAELQSMGDAAKKAGDGIEEIDPKPVDDTERSTTRLKFSLLDLAKTAFVVKAISAGFDMIKDSLDGAISRFDTLTIFPRTMEALGFSTGQVDRSMRKLDQGIQGLPTTLNDIVSNTQRIASVTGDLDMATDTALALNNAFLSNGENAADAARGTEQYVQMLSRGEVDMQSWRTLQETMTLALVRTAEAFGFAGESAQNDLYGALKAGNITFDEFNAKIIELNEEVGGFADLAITNSSSIRTAWANIQTAFVRGTANIITKLDELSDKLTNRSLAENLNLLQGVVNKAFSAIGSALDIVIPLIVETYEAFSWLMDTLEPITPLLKGVAAGFLTLMVINQLNGYLGTLNVTALALGKTFKYLELGMKSAAAMQVKAGAITKTMATIYGVATGAIGAKTVALGLATKAWVILKTTITALTGPVGWVIGAIGAVVGVVVALKNTIGEASPEMQQLSSEMSDAAQNTSMLSDEIDQSSEAFQTAQGQIEGQSQSLRNLIEDTVRLSEQERLSSGDKKLMKENIDELNKSMQGLNLVYDEEQGRLTASTEAMEARVQMMEEESKMIEAQERLGEISEQRAEATARLDENSRKLDEAQKLLDESGANWFGRNNELKESVSELEEENKNLQTAINDLAEDEVTANQMRAEAAEAYAAAQGEASSYAITSLESLTEAQRTAAEAMKTEYQSLVEKARDWSTAIETEYTKTNEAGEEYVVSSKEAFADAKATLEQNVEAMREWAENLDALSKRGIDDGLLEQLRSMGPEGLPLVEGFVNASDEELAEMESLFGESAELSKDALMNGLSIEEGSIIDGAEDLIFNTGESLVSAVESSGLSQILPDGLKEGKEDMIEAGKDVAEGAKQGIEQGSEGVSAASKDMASKVDEAFKGPLGIHSPSTVFAQHGTDIINGLLQGVNQSKPQVISAIGELGTAISQAMADAMKNMSTGSDAALSGFVKNVQASFRNANATVQVETATMNQTFQRGLSAMQISSSRGFQQIERASQTSFRGMSANIQRETSLITNTIRTSTMQMTNQTQQGMRMVEQTYQRGYAQIRMNTQRETSLLTQLVQRSMRTKQTTVQTGMRSQQTAVQNGMRSQVSVVRAGYTSMVTHARTSLNRVVSVTQSTMNQAVAIMRGTSSQAQSAGRNMGLGFRNGLASTQGGILSMARNIANSAASTIRSALKIHSPSRVTEALGKFTGEGLVVGMKDKVRDVERIADELARKAIPQIDVGRSLGTVGGASAASSAVYNNQSYILNAQAPAGGNWTKEDYQRLLRELAWYINQEGGALDG